MDLVTILGIIFSFACIIFGFSMEGGNILALLQPTAFLIVIGGTIGAVIISFPSETLKKFPKILKICFKKHNYDLESYILYFKDMAIKTRKNGLLSMESELSSINMDPFIKKGLQMVVDGIDSDSIRNILNSKLDNISRRHEKYIEIFSAAGGYSPTMGIIGTITSLVIILSNLSNAAVLGEKIAVAFVATLYGIGAANLIWLPIASKLREIDKEEIIQKELFIEAIVLIQEGVNPNTLVSKLEGFLPESINKNSID